MSTNADFDFESFDQTEYDAQQAREKKRLLKEWAGVGFFFFVFPPLAIFLLISGLADGKLLKNDGKPTTRKKTSAKKSASSYKPKSSGQMQIDKNEKRGKSISFFSAIATSCFAIGLFSEASDFLSALIFDGRFFSFYLKGIFTLLFFTLAGICTIFYGTRLTKRSRAHRKLLKAIGQKKRIQIQPLAQALGLSEDRVQTHLGEMLDKGILPAGYIDHRTHSLVLDSDGIIDEVAPQRAAPPKQQQDDESALLREIRAVNDAIAHPKLSQQIDKIEQITAKILEYKKRHADRAPQLHSFLSYYLPTTLKILRTYAQLEDQGVGGENIESSMKRIEDMMEKVVEGFEKQLDQLFQSDALDIASDVLVLERMLAKDGLSAQEEGFQLEL